MQRFFFDSRVGLDFVRDDQGQLLADIGVAEREAFIAAADIAREAVPKKGTTFVVIGVRNDAGNHLLSAAASLVVVRT